MVISDSSYAFVAFLKEAGVLCISWKLKPDTEQFRNIYWQALQFVKINPSICYYSTDISRIGPLDPEQEAWLSREYYPQVSDILGQDIYAAVIFSEGHFKALVNNYIASRLLPVHDFIHFNYFTEKEEAMDWLLYMQKGRDSAILAKS
ncbi:hypothetical protein K3G39_06445 [Pontibacter sp. HSC-14F20]|uniref:hypothetical protein n=1 Tax=Pontibacter sp. HSC-14F20 TaxID=2864136 RepID=UPI001C72D690|nr:hypothetical protein [Pontibacter sp. HSC-14F20]MBX0332871.1 hypothetical protein [Pontibacter sp. HSC-14F20]